MQNILLMFSTILVLVYTSLAFVAAGKEIGSRTTGNEICLGGATCTSRGILIWETAKTGDTAALGQVLASATPEDLTFEQECGVRQYSDGFRRISVCKIVVFFRHQVMLPSITRL
jgi:hypothetical protein